MFYNREDRIVQHLSTGMILAAVLLAVVGCTWGALNAFKSAIELFQ